jgi:NADH dehydrogenase
MAYLKNLAYGGSAATLGYLGWRAFSRYTEIARRKGCARGKTFVVIGAGFAGLAAACELARLLPDPDNGRILLIDEDNFLLFTPMLSEAAAGEIDARHIIHPVDRISKRIQFVAATVTGIDLGRKVVQVSRRSAEIKPAPEEYQADRIVIALGSITDFHDIPGLAETAIPMKKLWDATSLYRCVLARLEQASLEKDPERRKALLTFVVAGGGFSGVETMAALNDFVRESSDEYPAIARKDIRTILINPDGRLLHELTPDLAAYAETALKKRGVEVRMNSSVSGATGSSVEIQGGEPIPARTLVWTAGVKPNPLVEKLDCEKGKHGRIRVNACCEIPDRPGVCVIGDCAEIPQQDGTKTYAPTAQNATREGKHVARNIVAALRGGKVTPFRYTPIGELALVGRRSGVARLYGHNFSGVVAWAMWRATYLAKMPGTGQKLRIGADWLLDLLFGRVPFPIGPGASIPEVGKLENDAG